MPLFYRVKDSYLKSGILTASVEYNLLNLPKKVSKGTDNISYIYSATGTKLAMLKGITVVNFYAGTCVYKGNKTLDYALHPEGVVRATGQGLSYEYFLKDHLGNVRIVFGSDGAVLQTTDYYPFGMSHTPKAKENENRYLYNGKEQQDALLSGVKFDWYDYGARFYDPQLGRFHSVDPMVENGHHNYTPYAYAYNNPILYIDPLGLDTTIYVFDQGERPKDNGTKGETYTAEIYVDMDGEIVGPYEGSSYPNSKSNTDNDTKYNTVEEGEHKYNNESGHKGGTKKGLNVDDSNNGSRTTTGTNPDGKEVTMTGVNVHEGASDNGNHNSRGSKGCITINPKDSEAFFDNFDWSKNSAQTKGNSSGTIVIHRGNSVSSWIDKTMINIKKIFN